MSYTKLDLLQDLADMGLTGQETILIHSSMKSIGPVDGGRYCAGLLKIAIYQSKCPTVGGRIPVVVPSRACGALVYLLLSLCFIGKVAKYRKEN